MIKFSSGTRNAVGVFRNGGMAAYCLVPGISIEFERVPLFRNSRRRGCVQERRYGRFLFSSYGNKELTAIELQYLSNILHIFYKRRFVNLIKAFDTKFYVPKGRLTGRIFVLY